MQNVALYIEDMSVWYNGYAVVSNISLNVPYGALCAIIGPNGAGKSSIVKGALGLCQATCRNKYICGCNGKDVSLWCHKVAYIPQKSDIDWDFPIDVKGMLSLAFYHKSTLGFTLNEEDYEMIDYYMHKVGLHHLKEKNISDLSGGEKQRILMCRALLQDPDLYILDEPFWGIDKTTEHKLQSMLLDEQRKRKTIIIVHHNLYDIAMFDWFILLNKKVIACGKRDDTFSCSNLRATYQCDDDSFFKDILDTKK